MTDGEGGSLLIANFSSVVAVGASWLRGGAEGAEVEIVPGSAGRNMVDEGMAPWVFRQGVVLEVWTMPAANAGRSGEQGLQAFIAGRIATDIKLVEIEDAGQSGHGLMGDFFFCIAKLS